MARRADLERRRAGASKRDFRQLRRQVRALRLEVVDYGDPAAEADHYARAEPVIAAAIAARATRFKDLTVKAEALIWCAAGVDFGLGDTLGDRVIGSILDDLVAALRRQGRAARPEH